MLHLREADLTEMYSLLISRARKSQRKPVLAFWGCKALSGCPNISAALFIYDRPWVVVVGVVSLSLPPKETVCMGYQPTHGPVDTLK